MKLKTLLLIVFVITLALLWHGIPVSPTVVESPGDSLGREAIPPPTLPPMDLMQLSLERNQMTTDATSRESNALDPQWRLPDILAVKITRLPYQAPKPRYFESYLAEYAEAVEFLVETDGPFPVRALAPVLYVGDVAVTENEAVAENVYRFLAFEFDQLAEGAPISLGWPGQPKAQRLETKFRYEVPDYDQKEK